MHGELIQRIIDGPLCLRIQTIWVVSSISLRAPFQLHLCESIGCYEKVTK